MKVFITDEQKAELERFHDTTRDGRIRDFIQVVLLASEGWLFTMIVQALRQHEYTVKHHINPSNGFFT